jgi:hypothetical protein
MPARFTGRALVLALLGAFLCVVVWIVVTETSPYRANIGKLSATLGSSNGPNSRSARVALTNCGAGDLQTLGIILQIKEPDGTWREYSSTGFSVTLLPGGSHVVVLNNIKESGDYRPWVSYASELTGLRRWTNRFTRAIKKGQLSLLWNSGTTYKHGEVVGEVRHF